MGRGRPLSGIWTPYLSEADRAIFAATGYGAPGPSPRRPAPLVIDMTLDFCGPEGATALEAARAVRTACGPAAWTAVPHIARLIAAARAGKRPVIYTRRDHGRLAGNHSKTSRGTEDHEAGNEIVAPLAPAARETVLGKAKPSAFWRTGLDARLEEAGCDGVVLTGCTTSGCVRATALDAYNLDLPCLIVPDAVFDRFAASHAMSLFDLQAKYADLAGTDEVAGMLAAAHPKNQVKSSPR